MIVSKFGYTQHSANIFASAFVCTNFPVVASGEAGTATGSLYNIRMANKDAESFEYSSVTYTTEVKNPALAVEPVTVNTGEAAVIEVNVSNATAMTALQFNLSLPSGITLTDDDEACGIEYKNVIILSMASKC